MTHEEVENFINGRDPMERIVNITSKYNDDFVQVYYRDENDAKCCVKEKFYPFLWATLKACKRLCGGDRQWLRRLLDEYGIAIKKLSDVNNKGEVMEEFKDGYLFLIYAVKPMSYSRFLSFFKKAKNPVYAPRDKDGNEIDRSAEERRQYLAVPPVEQFMIATGKRFFKGYDDYDQILRLTYDLETTGLDTEKDKITQIGIRCNRPFYGRPNGFEKIINISGDTEEEYAANELKAIELLFKVIYTFKPDVVTGHNIENFDFNMLIGACKRLGTSIEELTAKYFDGESVHKETRTTILKLGGEIETFNQTVIPNTTVTDSLHAVRRAQALDSNMQKADLKYITNYANLKKKNRVYTPGNKIAEIYWDTEHQYAFNDNDGDWYIYDPSCGNGVKSREDFGSDTEYGDYLKSIKGKQGDNPFKMKTRNVLMDGYEIVTGKYIIERYLLDDIWEGDRVEWKYNNGNFLICKMLPIPFKKCTTMGTAGQWRSLMMAWSYEKNIAIPMFRAQSSFTGGLSRLLKTGYVDNVIKLDYNSLYPSIILTWGICDTNDLTGAMLIFLEYFLTTREKYKKLKKEAGKRVDAVKSKILDGTATEEEKKIFNQASADVSLNDNRQSGRKVFCNSFFGSFGNPNVFNWGSLMAAEKTTCTGRQALRLMISHFSELGYVPVVGDSVVGDTPLFIKYKKGGYIDIKPISEIFNDAESRVDGLGRCYDYSEKDYQVLCRSGWQDIKYVYKHETDKDIYNVSDGVSTVECTEDHSLFNDKQEEIKPKEITESTKLEYYNGDVKPDNTVCISPLRLDVIGIWAKELANGVIDRVPFEILNANRKHRMMFYKIFMQESKEGTNYSKTCLAGIQYILKN